MIKIVEITSCAECPYFNNEYYGYEETCTKLNRRIKLDSENSYIIPEDCPLESKEE